MFGLESSIILVCIYQFGHLVIIKCSRQSTHYSQFASNKISAFAIGPNQGKNPAGDTQLSFQTKVKHVNNSLEPNFSS